MSRRRAKWSNGDGRADLIVANNVLAHVPDLHDFVHGMKLLLADDGVAVIEVQHLLRLIERNQFDTIYHEHFCYYTLLSFSNVLRCHGLNVFDVEELATHGGSLRIYFQHGKPVTSPQSSGRELAESGTIGRVSQVSATAISATAWRK